jgi:hypothetical protein
MPYFKVDELLNLSFDGKLSYELPESTKCMLVELESLLEITDAVGSDATADRKEYKSYDVRNSSKHDFVTVKSHRNRYDLDYVPHLRKGEKDKKRDFRHKVSESITIGEWKKGTPGSSVKIDSSEVDKEWEMMRSFKATKIESKTGIEKTVNDLRISLNKISSANYDKQRDSILALVNGYFEATDEQTEANTRRISKAIFDIASTNKFYSEIYAKLYAELVSSHKVFADMLEELMDAFMAMDTIPIYIDPDTDYDGFCAYSKACDIRKSTSTFIVNCLKFGLITSSRVADVLLEFVKYVDVKRLELEYSKCIEEVVENIYIISTLCTSELSGTEKWRDVILPLIKTHADKKNNGFPGISNRATFKLLDLLEKI